MSKREDQSIAESISSALSKDAEDHARWDDVRRLQDRAGDEVFAAAARLIEGGSVPERQLGVDILAQGQVAQKPLRDRAIPLLRNLAAREQDAGVIASLCHAFGHLHDQSTIDDVRRWVQHPDGDVRFAVVHGVSGYNDANAIETLIQLSADDDSDVRDWAAFGLGTLVDVDTAPIRAALRARLSDPDDDTCLEALAGLARRGDAGVITALRVLLADPEADHLPLEAGLPLADPAFHGALVRLASAWEGEAVLSNTFQTLVEAVGIDSP